MELVFLNLISELQDKKIYHPKGSGRNRVFSDRFVQVAKTDYCRGNTLEITKLLYRLLFDQHQPEKDHIITYFPQNSFREPTPADTPPGHAKTQKRNTPGKKADREMQEKITAVLNSEQQQRDVIGSLFAGFKRAAEIDLPRALNAWREKAADEAAGLGYSAFKFSVFDAIRTPNEFKMTLENVTDFPTLVNFEMFIDLLNRSPKFYAKAPQTEDRELPLINIPTSSSLKSSGLK